MLVTAPQNGYKTTEEYVQSDRIPTSEEPSTKLLRGWSSRRPLLRLRPPLQMETVVLVAQAAPLRLRSHSSSMPRAPQE